MNINKLIKKDFFVSTIMAILFVIGLSVIKTNQKKDVVWVNEDDLVFEDDYKETDQITDSPIIKKEAKKNIDFSLVDIDTNDLDYQEIKGDKQDCQPDFFDPEEIVYKKIETKGYPEELYEFEGEDGEIYQFMIDGWQKEAENKLKLNYPYDVTNYEFGCASSFSFVSEIKKNDKRQRLFTHVENYLNDSSLSEDKRLMYLSWNYENGDKEWIKKNTIYNIYEDELINLPNLECVSRNGFWSGNKLITYSDKNSSENVFDYYTKVCIWNDEGGLETFFESNLAWGSASTDYLVSEIGLLPKEKDTFFAYTGIEDTVDYRCSLFLWNIIDNKIKEFEITKNDSYYCPEIEFNWNKIRFDSETVNYRLLDEDNKWTDWQTKEEVTIEKEVFNNLVDDANKDEYSNDYFYWSEESGKIYAIKKSDASMMYDNKQDRDSGMQKMRQHLDDKEFYLNTQNSNKYSLDNGVTISESLAYENGDIKCLIIRENIDYGYGNDTRNYFDIVCGKVDQNEIADFVNTGDVNIKFEIKYENDKFVAFVYGKGDYGTNLYTAIKYKDYAWVAFGNVQSVPDCAIVDNFNIPDDFFVSCQYHDGSMPGKTGKLNY